jgi:hypothetical protein
MKALGLALFALVFMGLAHARPVVIEEVATLSPPDASWEILGGFGIAIDGDHALVSGERFIEDPAAPGGSRHEGAAFLYQRSGTSWNHVGQLGPVSTITDLALPGLAMKDGVAMTIIGNARIFELAGGTWTQAPLASSIASALQGADIDIDAGRILAPRNRCKYESVVLRKIGGAWSIEGELGGIDCRTSTAPHTQDLQGTRAIVHNPEGIGREPHRAIRYRLNIAGTGWERFSHAEISAGPYVALSGPNWAIAGIRQGGTRLFYDPPGNDSGFGSFHSLQPVDGLLQPGNRSASSLERVGAMFAQRNFSFDRDAYVINLFRINDDVVRSSTHMAQLQARSGESLGMLLDSSNNRIIVNGHGDTGGDNTVRVFELPTSFEQPAVQVHDFESASSGAAWQPTPGSTFSVVSSGTTRMYRQASTAGNPASHLPTAATTNQAIQTEVIIRGFTGANAWVGLNTRRQDDANYYYVTLRLSGAVELKRMAGGVFTTLASGPATVTTGRMYRLRLQSIGAAHSVYLDDRLVLTAQDTTLTEGTVGVMTNRAAADYDNVVVTPNPFATIYVENFTSYDPGDWWDAPGQWEATGGVLRPVRITTTGFARTLIRILGDDQVVQARIRPTSFAEPDNWVGLIARYQSEDDYLYVSLRGRGVISLWRRTNGLIHQLATTRMPVTTGTWYHVRLEVIDGITRVFVNGTLRLSSNADPGPDNPNVDWQRGWVGLIAYRALADYDDFLAYQP